MSVNGENGSILDQYKITSFDGLHIPPKMFVDLLKQVRDKSHKAQNPKQ